jgi:hypothetical protein
VTIAANQDATITGIKRFDQSARASSGTVARPMTSPAAVGTTRNTTMKGIPEQIQTLEADRAKTATRIEELKTKCNGDLDELDNSEQTEPTTWAPKPSRTTPSCGACTMRGSIQAGRSTRPAATRPCIPRAGRRLRDEIRRALFARAHVEDQRH